MGQLRNESNTSWASYVMNQLRNGSINVITYYLAANKIDLASAVDLTDVRIWAEQKGFKFVKSSAATAEGVSGKFF